MLHKISILFILLFTLISSTAVNAKDLTTRQIERVLAGKSVFQIFNTESKYQILLDTATGGMTLIEARTGKSIKLIKSEPIAPQGNDHNRFTLYKSSYDQDSVILLDTFTGLMWSWAYKKNVLLEIKGK